MSSNPAGVTYDIRIALDKFRKDLRDAESDAQASASRIKQTSAAAASSPGASSAANAADESRERFLSTQRAQRVNVERQTTEELAKQAAAGERMTSAFVKLSLAVLAIKSTVAVVGGGIEAWGALTADSQKKFEEAAKGYLSFADKLSSIPIVGSIARQGAELLSGGAGAAATKALADAQAIEAHTLQIKAQIAQHAKDEAASEQAITAAKIAALPADQQALATAKLQHDSAIAEIDRRQKSKEIGEDTAGNLRTAEDLKLQTAQRVKFEDDQQKIRRLGSEQAAAEARANNDEKLAQQIEFEEQLRQAEVEAARRGGVDLQAVQEANAAKRAAREVQLAREAEEEKTKDAEEFAKRRLAQEQQLQDDLQRILDRNAQEQQQTEDVQFDTEQRRRRRLGDTQGADAADIVRQTEKAVRDAAAQGGAAQDAVIQNAVERVLGWKGPRAARPEVTSAAAFGRLGLNSGITDPQKELTDVQKQALEQLKQIAKNVGRPTPAVAA
jgi:hypothetical protein